MVLIASGYAIKTAPPVELNDRIVEAFKLELLDKAFGFATAIPLQPHIKDRAHYQEAAVEAALELDQPSRALRYADQIPNWRQGLAYADYALYSVQHGQTNGVAELLEKADASARTATQDWRRERVWIRIYQVCREMGRADKAAEYGAVLRKSDNGTAQLQKNKLCTDAEFDEYTANLDKQIAIGDLDLKRFGLTTYVALYDRFYADATRRMVIENKVEAGWSKIPLFDRVDLMQGLALNAMKHGNRDDAVRLANKAADIVNNAEWPAEYHVKLLAKIAKLQIDCGERDAAMHALKSAMEIFDTETAEIINIYRTEALLPVAETYAQADDAATAQKVYALAVEQAVVNANSRPRAEDLCQILLSMATHGIQPETALTERINDIERSLGDPW